MKEKPPETVLGNAVDAAVIIVAILIFVFLGWVCGAFGQTPPSIPTSPVLTNYWFVTAYAKDGLHSMTNSEVSMLDTNSTYTISWTYPVTPASVGVTNFTIWHAYASGQETNPLDVVLVGTNLGGNWPPPPPSNHVVGIVGLLTAPTPHGPWIAWTNKMPWSITNSKSPQQYFKIQMTNYVF